MRYTVDYISYKTSLARVSVFMRRRGKMTLVVFTLWLLLVLLLSLKHGQIWL